MLGIVAGIAAGLGMLVALLVASRRRRQALAQARAQAAALLAQARAHTEQDHRQAEITAREEALATRATAQEELGALRTELDRRDENLARHEQALALQEERLTQERAKLTAQQNALAAREQATQAAVGEVRRLEGEYHTGLDRVAGETCAQVKNELVQGWVEEARAEAAASLRTIDQNAADPEHGREAERIMAIAVGRYQGHYLTERLLSTIALPPGIGAKLLESAAHVVKEVEAQAGTKMVLSDLGDALRIEGPDGVGREVARRVIHRLLRGGDGGQARPATDSHGPNVVVRDAKRFVQSAVANVDREIVDLGKKAFAELDLEKAHPELMKLVGRLHYRTSYTQNQWKHSVEAAFLAGIMACELGLDPVLARRATLLHDIGKALTHAIDGSHALIGADYASRLGENPVIVNAIAAHHGDEPGTSPYAHIVAAADALSGGRPGARREMVETYVKRIADLEHIAQGFAGIDRVYAVQAGREVRVHVLENQVSDRGAAEMATAIAARISRELVFPGQIKVTVIRELRAVELAG